MCEVKGIKQNTTKQNKTKDGAQMCSRFPKSLKYGVLRPKIPQCRYCSFSGGGTMPRWATITCKYRQHLAKYEKDKNG
jgi:hypothetical protein